MIKGLTIQNFLSHKKTTIEFSEGVNIIVGPTDSGKSAIIKALKWLITNRPLGDSVRSYWGGDTKVIARFNKEEVVRVRGDRDNAYHVKQLDEYIKFNAIKGEVPQEVCQVLDLEELNIQTQFSPHFLLSKSSGEVAQYFNKIAHLDKIDTASQNIRRWLRNIQQQIVFKEDFLKELESQFEQYNNLDEIHNKIIKIESIEKEIFQINSTINDLQDLLTGLEKILENIQEFSFLIDLDDLVERIFVINNELRTVKISINELNDLTNSLKLLDNNYNVLEKQKKELEERFHKELGKGKVCPLCGSLLT